jgi:hypothetical protein
MESRRGSGLRTTEKCRAESRDYEKFIAAIPASTSLASPPSHLDTFPGKKSKEMEPGTREPSPLK